MSGVPTFALERWFAEQQPTARLIDLSGSGAPPRTLRALLAVATRAERVALSRLSLGYGPGQGSAELRSIVAARYRGIRPDDVLVTAGAIEALHLAVAALVDRGDEVIVQEPMYPAVSGLARLRGARVVPWRLAAEDGFHASVLAVTRLLSARTALVAITQPNGPTGSVLEDGELDQLVAALAPRGIRLLSDEVYRDLVLEPGLRVPSAVERYERALSVGDVAKPYGLGGLRIGWLAMRDREARQRIAALRDYTTLSSATPSEALAAIALRHHESLTAEPIRHARTNLRVLTALARRDHALRLDPPRAGVSAFPGVRGADTLQRALRAEGVLVVPGALFGHPDRLRIALAGPPAEFAVALERLAALLA